MQGMSVSLCMQRRMPQKSVFCKTASGETGLNYLCKGYYQYFGHVAPYMDFMKKELLAQRPPANIMEAIRKWHIITKAKMTYHSLIKI